MTDIFARYIAVFAALRPELAFATAAFSFIVFLTTRWVAKEFEKESLDEERWLPFFGGAFAIFTAAYSVRFAASIVAPTANAFNSRLSLINLIGSPLISFCFLAAAVHLRGRWSYIRRQHWIVIFAILGVASASQELVVFQLGHRVADATLSAACVAAFGWAIGSNIGFRGRPGFATLASLGPLFYVFLNIIYALNPFFAASVLWPDLRLAVARSLNEANHLRYVNADVLYALDSAVFGLGFAAKLLMFLGPVAILLRMWTVIHPAKTRAMLTGITDGRLEPISHEGILKALGNSCAADLVALAFILPDSLGKKVGWWRWIRASSDGAPPSGYEVYDLPAPDRSIVASVLVSGREEHTGHLDRHESLKRRYWKYVSGMNSLVTVPIKFHGGVIGALNLEWRRRHGYQPTSVPRFRQIAALLAPGVHWRRQLVALQSLGNSFSLLAARSALSEPSQTGTVARALHNVLSPLATGLCLEIGFRPMFFACTDGFNIPDLQVGTSADMHRTLGSLLGDDPDVVVLRTPLMATTDQTDGPRSRRIGELALAVRTQHDDPQRPTLAWDSLHRDAVAALVVDTLLDIVRMRLMEIIERLEEALMSRANAVDDWFAAVLDAAGLARIPWIVAEVSTLDGRTRTLGIASDAEVVDGLRKHAVDTEKRFPSLRLERSHGVTQDVLILQLHSSKARLWLGLIASETLVEGPASWPWRVFLEDFGRAADLALHRILARDIQVDSDQSQRLAIAGITISTLAHQLKNSTAVPRAQVDNLLESVRLGSVKLDDLPGRLEAVARSCKRLDDLAMEINGVSCMPKHKPCRLAEVTQYACELFDGLTKGRGIDIEVSIPSDLSADVPFDVAALAIANLLNNSIDAIIERGTIVVTATTNDDGVALVIVDSGPGIDPTKSEDIFKDKYTTKRGGRGVGLYFARRTLKEHRSHVVLTSPIAGSTTFTITMPK